MPVTYGEVEEYRRAVERQRGADEAAEVLTDGDIAEALEMMSRWVDDAVGRGFSPDGTAATPATHYVAGGGGRRLYIPDLVNATSIAIDDGSGTYATAVDPAHAGLIYAPEPRRAGYPAEAIELLPFAPIEYWPRGRYDVRIVGRFGWDAVPVGIERATIRIAAVWRLEIPEQVVPGKHRGTRPHAPNPGDRAVTDPPIRARAYAVGRVQCRLKTRSYGLATARWPGCNGCSTNR